MVPDVLVHLVEPGAWRAALDRGDVRPPCPESGGLVHLCSPARVHVPAERPFPGRRDQLLLVVDPARLPTRPRPGSRPELAEGEEDGGLPLHGPLPTSAVTAVVPFRPPMPPRLPAPDDILGRALTFYASLPVRRAVRVEDVPGGVAVLDPDHLRSRDNNRLVLTEPVDAATIETAAAEVAGDAGWPHRAAALLWPDAGPVAAELAAAGWDVDEVVLMARPADRVPGGDRAEVVAQHDVHDLWERSWRRDLGGIPDLDRVVADLVGREHLNDRVVAVRDVVVRDEGRVVAAGQLRVDGATAAIDSVLTDPAARGRGYGDAVVARSLTLAAEAGCDLVVLEAAADDWPRNWYARRGFGELASVWGVSRDA